MRYSNLRGIFGAFVFAILLATTAKAETITGPVSGTISVLSSSANDNANVLGYIYMASPSPSMDSSCNSNRAYIPADDKALYATALSASLSNKTVGVFYATGANTQTLPGAGNFSCRVVNIYW